MMPRSPSTRIGLVKPNSRIDAAICATWASEWVRALRAYGTSRPQGGFINGKVLIGGQLNRPPSLFEDRLQLASPWHAHHKRRQLSPLHENISLWYFLSRSRGDL